MENSLHASRPTEAGLQVYIVEDSDLVRVRLEELVVSIAGARCVGHAGSADAAIQGIRDSRPNTVVLDIGLAQGTGFDVLRAVGSGSDLPIYVLSNFATEPYRRHAMRLGAAGFFDKTTEIERMHELLVRRAMQFAVMPN